MFSSSSNILTELLNQVSGGNDFIKGAVSLWFLGIATYLCKNVPKQIFSTVKQYSVTEMTFNNGGYGQEILMICFYKWLKPLIRENLSRTLSIISSWDSESAVLGIGYGTHFFFYKKRLFWITKQRLESNGSERQKEEIKLGTFGRSHKLFISICDEFIPKKTEDEVRLFRLSSDFSSWETYQNPVKRSLDTVALSSKLKNSIQEQIEYFLENKSWFHKTGLPYKLTYLLHGKPGGGKTSLIKAIASTYNMNICILNINSLTDTAFERACATMPSNSILVIEDFDSSSSTVKRVENAKQSNSIDIPPEYKVLSLTGILNVLDGINPLDSCIIFLTTNYLENIDDALYRKGRVDYLIEINEVSGEDIKSYCKRIFPGYTHFDDFTFNEALGCKLNEALLYSKDDPERFLDSLKQNKIAVSSLA